LIFDWRFLICFYHTPSSTIAQTDGDHLPFKSKIGNQKSKIRTGYFGIRTAGISAHL
jgi:hypothetical protein